MKIISKYKDYYDYLTGIYGIDEKLILDRTEFHITDHYVNNSKVIFFICGYQVDGLYRDGNFYYGDQLKQFIDSEKKNSRWKWFRWDVDSALYYSIKTNITGKGEYNQFLKEPAIDKGKYNELFNCPILIVDSFGKYTKSGFKFSKFPILKDYGLTYVFSPDKIWQMIYDFLSKTKDIPNNQTDKEKIVSRGFDLKTSFRNTK